MKISRILLIIGIVAIISAFAISTSFAASSENIYKYKIYGKNNYNKKIVTINKSYVEDYKLNIKYSYKINIKNKYKSKYKIKSVNITYVYDDINNVNFGKVFYKNYNGKNKNTIKIKDPQKNLWLKKITINYYTKGKIKKESPNIQNYSSSINNWKTTTYYYGNKSNVKLSQGGSTKFNADFRIYLQTSKNKKFKVTAKDKKSKIKKVQVVYVGVDSLVESIKTYNGYGKNSLRFTSYKNTDFLWIGKIKVFYY